MADALDIARHLRSRARNLLPVRGFFFDRPLLLLHSDDWGRVGVRDKEGFAELQASGIALGENPYDFYSLETAADVIAACELLQRHHDSTGRSPCLVMNFLLANLDFQKTSATGFRQLHLRLLQDGLPGKWSRPGLFEAYRQGIADGVFYPALHGLTHFSQRAVEHCMLEDGPRGALLRKLWEAETPYIYWRMPWIGYEYWSPEPMPEAGFLSAGKQEVLVQQSVSAFTQFFGRAAFSACAPGYRANQDTHRAWASYGVRVAQNGSGGWLPPQTDEFGILNVCRAVDFEPAVHPHFSLQKSIGLAEECFARGLPAIVSVHAINFHSTLKDFRGPTLHALDQFLSALEAKHPNLLYLHDADLLQLVEQGRYQSVDGAVSVCVAQRSAIRPRAFVTGGD
jgi:hypothetical protein